MFETLPAVQLPVTSTLNSKTCVVIPTFVSRRNSPCRNCSHVLAFNEPIKWDRGEFNT